MTKNLNSEFLNIYFILIRKDSSFFCFLFFFLIGKNLQGGSVTKKPLANAGDMRDMSSIPE